MFKLKSKQISRLNTRLNVFGDNFFDFKFYFFENSIDGYLLEIFDENSGKKVIKTGFFPRIKGKIFRFAWLGRKYKYSQTSF